MIPIPLNTASRVGLNVLLLLAGVIALYYGEPVFVPVLIALLFATVLGPAAVWLNQALKIRWGLACITVIFGLVMVNLLITAVFSASVTRLVNRLSNEREVLQIYKDFRAKLAKASPGELDSDLLPENPEKINEIGILQYLREAAPAIMTQIAKYTSLWSWRLIVTFFITFFILLEGRMLARRAVAIFGPSAEVQAKASEVLFEMAKQVRTYLVWRTLINLGLAIVMGAVYQSAGLSQAWTWAILLAILNYIPYVGPVLASAPPFLDAFIFAGPSEAIFVTTVFWVVIVLEGYLVVPLLMGRNMDLNATTVMVACLFWELVWGMSGLFLAMPIMAAIKAILNSTPDWQPWAKLMSSTDDEPKLPLEPVAATALPDGAAVVGSEVAVPHVSHAERS